MSGPIRSSGHICPEAAIVIQTVHIYHISSLPLTAAPETANIEWAQDFVSIPGKRSTDYSGVVLVSTGVMQLVKLSPCDGLNGKNKYKR